ncbi:MAG TPA: hypothetical protein VGQ59_07775 [Cyclobacteriaceae bacterium]|jgi:hypothetical protein|nr:hypothetical protein [Cyclobacteriaceae bacterium]
MKTKNSIAKPREGTKGTGAQAELFGQTEKLSPFTSTLVRNMSYFFNSYIDPDFLNGRSQKGFQTPNHHHL